MVARTLSISSDGVHLAILDQEEKLNKMYSYFEPKVFQSFVEFLSAFGNFLASNKIKSPLWGTNFNYQEGERNISYLADSSIAFEQSFSRYLKQNFKEGVDLGGPKEEANLKSKFTLQVQDLFKSTAETALAPFWIGLQQVTVLGGAPGETIERALQDGKSQLNFVNDILDHYTHDRWISSALLKKSEKGELLPKVLSEHFGTQEVERRYLYKIHGAELSQEWKSFGLVDIFEDGGASFKKTGLISFLDENFRWMYSIQKELNFTNEWIVENQHKVKFFHGANLDRTGFSQMMKLFMMGQKVVLDLTGLPPELDRRLQIFMLENSLKVQTVNFVTTINLSELGDGRFITYEGSRLQTEETTRKFWSHLFRYFNLNHVDINLGTDVFSLWRIRATSPTELNYLDVRRVNFYNPTSYKKQVTIHTKGGFAFLKMIDPSKATAKSVSHGVEVELLPHGRIALDFGHYEET